MNGRKCKAKVNLTCQKFKHFKGSITPLSVTCSEESAIRALLHITSSQTPRIGYHHRIWQRRRRMLSLPRSQHNLAFLDCHTRLWHRWDLNLWSLDDKASISVSPLRSQCSNPDVTVWTCVPILLVFRMYKKWLLLSFLIRCRLQLNFTLFCRHAWCSKAPELLHHYTLHYYRHWLYRLV